MFLKWKAEGSKNPTSYGAPTVEAQEGDPQSLLNWTRALIALRKANTAFWADSAFEPIFDEANPYPMVYRRKDGAGNSCIVILNPTAKQRKLTLPDMLNTPEVLLSDGKVSFKTTKKGTQFSIGPVSSLVIREL